MNSTDFTGYRDYMLFSVCHVFVISLVSVVGDTVSVNKN